MKNLIVIAVCCLALLFVGSQASACNTTFVSGFACNSHAQVLVAPATVVPYGNVQIAAAPAPVVLLQQNHCAGGLVFVQKANNRARAFGGGRSVSRTSTLSVSRSR